MGNLTWTGYANHPRLLVRDTDLAAMQARSTSTAKHRALWDNVLIPRANTLAGQTDAQLTSSAEGTQAKFLLLAVAGWITGTASYHNKLLSASKYLAGLTWSGFTSRRYQLLAQGYAYTFLRSGVITFSDADRLIVGGSITQNSTANGDPDEYMDGHSRGNLMSQFAANVAIKGESGTGFNFDSAATANINEALDFWYGSTPSGPAAYDTERYYSADGGSGKGAWYNTIASWHAWNLLMAARTGLTNTQLNGQAFDLIADEEWIENVVEWWVHAYDRGDYDYLKQGDTARSVAPWVHHDARFSLSAFAGFALNWKSQARWLLDRLTTYMINVLGTNPLAEDRAYEFLFFDPESVPSTSPDGVLSRSRLLTSNDYFFRSNWTPDQSCIAHITAHEYYKTNHQHLDCGSMQIMVRGEPVLLDRGYYNSGDKNAELTGTHRMYWAAQSIAHSGLVLVDDGAATSHRGRVNNNGGNSIINLPHARGGQLFREYLGSLVPSDAKSMRQAAGGDAWRRVGKTNGVDKFRIVEESTGNFTHLAADLKLAYLKEYDDAQTRVSRYDAQWLVIWNNVLWQWPVIFALHRVATTFAGYTKRLNLNFFGPPVISPYQGNFAKRVNAYGLNQVGRVICDTYGIWNTLTVGTQTSIGSGYFSDQFSYSPGSTNWKPTTGVNSTRHFADIGRYRVELIPQQLRLEDYFPTVYFPCLLSQTALGYAWFEEDDWFGLNFGGGNEFRLHKTSIEARVIINGEVISGGGGGPDIPPAAPVGLQAFTGPGGGQATLTWTPNTEEDLKEYVAFYRLKV